MCQSRIAPAPACGSALSPVRHTQAHTHKHACTHTQAQTQRENTSTHASKHASTHTYTHIRPDSSSLAVTTHTGSRATHLPQDGNVTGAGLQRCFHHLRAGACGGQAQGG